MTRYRRGKNVKVTYMGNNKNNVLGEGQEHLLCIDGENWGYKNTVAVETMPESVEQLCDVQYYFGDYLKSF